MKLSKSYDALKAKHSGWKISMRRNFCKSRSLPESVRDYIALQVRIELLQEPAANSAEEAVEEQQVTKTTLLQREVNQLEKNYFYWRNANALLACIAHLEKSISFIADAAVEQ